MSLTVISPKATAIAKLNDLLRASFVGGKVMMTAAVAELPATTKDNVLFAVRHFSDFTEDNDPHGEHDCAFFEVEGERYYFKVDYYDKKLEYGSNKPEDPGVTTRVLTIGTAADYLP